MKSKKSSQIEEATKNLKASMHYQPLKTEKGQQKLTGLMMKNFEKINQQLERLDQKIEEKSIKVSFLDRK